MKIGLISDTHGYFDPKIGDLFNGVEHILHAGDIGRLSVLDELLAIAPVTAVVGNVDDAPSHKETEILDLGEWRFLVHHIVEPLNWNVNLKERIEKTAPDAVIFGHTHKPFHRVVNGIKFINPGYAGKQRFNLPRSVALLDTAAPCPAPEFSNL